MAVSPPLPPSDQRQGSDIALRQQLSIHLAAEPGVHSLIPHVPSNLEHPPGVPAAQYQPVSETHPRSECPRRQPVKKTSHHHIIDTE